MAQNTSPNEIRKSNLGPAGVIVSNIAAAINRFRAALSLDPSQSLGQPPASPQGQTPTTSAQQYPSSAHQSGGQAQSYEHTNPAFLQSPPYQPSAPFSGPPSPMGPAAQGHQQYGEENRWQRDNGQQAQVPHPQSGYLQYPNQHPQSGSYGQSLHVVYPHGGLPPGQYGHAGYNSTPVSPYGSPYRQQLSPRPTFSNIPTAPSSGYSLPQMIPPDMMDDAVKLSGNIIGMKWDEVAKGLINMNPLQMDGLKRSYRDLPNNPFHNDLLSDIQKLSSKDKGLKVEGKFKDTLTALVQGPLERDVLLLRKAIKGFGNNTNSLNEVLMGRSNADIKAIMCAYEQKYGKPFIYHINKERTLSSHMRSMYAHVAKVDQRKEGSEEFVCATQAYSDDKAKQDAKNEVIKLKTARTNDVGFYTLLLEKNDLQVQAINDAFKKDSPLGIIGFIQKEFMSTSIKHANLKAALSLFVSRALDRAQSDAQQMERSMDGDGTDDELLIRLAVGMCWDRTYVKSVKDRFEELPRPKSFKLQFEKTPEQGTSLRKRIDEDTSGLYRATLMWCINEDYAYPS